LPTQEEILEIMRKATIKPELISEEVSKTAMEHIMETKISEEVLPPTFEAPTKVSKEPSTNDLLVSLIGQGRRTNSLLEQIRNTGMGIPMSPSELHEGKSNGQ
jgi:aspartokinase